jgi:hypothetical protein
MFINMHKCVPIQLKFKFAPFVTTLHYMPHWIKLTMYIIFALPLIF